MIEGVVFKYFFHLIVQYLHVERCILGWVFLVLYINMKLKVQWRSEMTKLEALSAALHWIGYTSNSFYF